MEEIIDGGETLTVEFKRSANDRDLYEAVACMANASGGVLLIGVDDDRRVVGAAPRHGRSTDPAKLAAAIQNNTEPPLPVTVDLHKASGAEVIAVHVPVNDLGPVGTKKGSYTKRVMGADGRPSCVAITPLELISRAYSAHGIDYARSPAAEASMEDLDPQEFQRFRTMCSRTTSDGQLAALSDVDICHALGLVPPGYDVSLGMILLFGGPEALSRWAPTAEVLFQDTRRGSFQVNERLHAPLLQQAEEIHQRLEARNSTTEVTVGLYRVDLELLPSMVRREAVANALVHRDYSQLGPVTVQLTDDELSVSSPGGFPPGVTLENILEQSRPRSMVLADAFKRAGLVERRGKGINEMFESQLRSGRDAPDFSRSTAESVTVSVSLGSADFDLVRFLTRFQEREGGVLSFDELRAVHEVKMSGPTTSTELSDYLSWPRATGRHVNGSLVEKGIFEARGSGRNRRFQLTASFYETAQEQSAYVRAKPFEPLQQRRMVLDYIAAFGAITRSQAADLCQLTAPASSKLLQQMRAAGEIEMRGERRGAHYVLARSRE